MKKISYWALANPWKAQVIITSIQIFLVFAAIYSGVWLYAHDILIPKFFAHLGLGLFFIALIFYPIRRAKYKLWKLSFVKQKTMDGLMLLSYMLMVVSISNNDARAAMKETVNDQISQTIVHKPLNQEQAKEKKMSFRDRRAIKKKIRKAFKKFVKERKQKAAGDEDVQGKVAGVVLVIGLLMIVVIMLSCAVGCSGANGLALLILVGGWALLIALGIVWARSIKGTKKKNYKPAPVPKG